MGGFRGTNVRVAAVAFLLLVSALSYRELIPVRDGAGYDGAHYFRWAQVLSVEALRSPRTERPPGVNVTTYNVRRILLPMTLHYVMRGLGIQRDRANVLATFTGANILLLTLAVLLLCLAADELGMGDRGKWLSGLALVVSYVNWKMPIFYPALTDSAAVAFGAGMLLCYLRGRVFPLAVLTLAGGFVWPSLPYFGLLMIAFPRERIEKIDPAPASLNRIAAAATAIGALAYIAYLWWTGYDVKASPVEPIRWLLPLSAAIVAAFLYAALAPLLDSAALWRDAVPWKALRRWTLWLAVGTYAAGALLVRSIDRGPDPMGYARAVSDSFATAVTQPGIFVVAHALHYGPLLLFVLLLWRPISESVRRQGTGLVLCFALAIVLGAGSESRKLMNFYPVAVLFLVQAAAPVLASPRRLAAVVALSVLFSKIWLPMSGPLSLPFGGEVTWRALYASSRGPWIDHGWWAAQGIVVLAVGALFYVWSKETDGRASVQSSSP